VSMLGRFSVSALSIPVQILDVKSLIDTPVLIPEMVDCEHHMTAHALCCPTGDTLRRL
jgi:hypothetical protein